MGFMDRLLGLSEDNTDLQRDRDDQHMFTLRTDDEWERMERFENHEVDRYGREVDDRTDPDDLYQD